MLLDYYVRYVWLPFLICGWFSCLSIHDLLAAVCLCLCFVLFALMWFLTLLVCCLVVV